MKQIYALLFILFNIPFIVWAQVEVQGSVYDRTTGLPLRGVEIQILESFQETQTNRAGEFKFPNLAPGVYYLLFQAPGYEPITKDIELRKDREIFSIGVALSPQQSETRAYRVISPQRASRDPQELPHPVRTIQSGYLRAKQQPNLASTISRVPGAWQQVPFQGGNQVQLRGLTGSRLPVYLNGVRLTNTGWQPGGSSAFWWSISPSEISQIEVLKGSGSTQYGSDALTGLIHLQTQSPSYQSDRWTAHGALTAQVSSRNFFNETGGQLSLSGPALAAEGSFHFGSLRDRPLGEGQGTLPDVGLTTARGHFAFKARISPKLELQVFNQSSSLANGSLQTQFAPIYSGTIQASERRLSLLRLQGRTASRWFRRINFQLSNQLQSEDKVFRWQDTGLERASLEEVRTFGSTLEVESSPIRYWKFVSGVEVYADQLQSGATYEGATATLTEDRGTFAPDAQARQVSLFSLHTLDLLKLRLSFGGRAQAYTQEYESRLDQVWVLVGNISGMYPLSDDYQLYFSTNTGYRNPNIFDATSLAPLPWGFATPSDSLSGERSFTSELGLRAQTGMLRGSVALYRSQIDDYIDWIKGQYQGSDTYQGLPVYQQTNRGQAYVQGVEAELELSVSHFLALYGGMSYAYGANITRNQPLSSVAPFNGRLGVRYRNRRGIWSLLEWRHAGKQDRLSPVDLWNPLVPAAGTANWNVIDLHLGWDLRWGYAMLGISNLLNEPYFFHGSGVGGTGRVFITSLKLGF
ncbi:MAG: TonB-dependent receptor [Bacteroidota bacterium]